MPDTTETHHYKPTTMHTPPSRPPSAFRVAKRKREEEDSEALDFPTIDPAVIHAAEIVHQGLEQQSCYEAIKESQETEAEEVSPSEDLLGHVRDLDTEYQFKIGKSLCELQDAREKIERNTFALEERAAELKESIGHMKGLLQERTGLLDYMRETYEYMQKLIRDHARKNYRFMAARAVSVRREKDEEAGREVEQDLFSGDSKSQQDLEESDRDQVGTSRTLEWDEDNGNLGGDEMDDHERDGTEGEGDSITPKGREDNTPLGEGELDDNLLEGVVGDNLEDNTHFDKNEMVDQERDGPLNLEEESSEGPEGDEDNTHLDENELDDQEGDGSSLPIKKINDNPI